MASAGTRAAAALLFSFSAVLALFLLRLLQAPRRPGLAAGADLMVAVVGRFLDGRGGLLELLATRRNMILLCHAILLLILRDAGVLGKSASCRPGPGETETATAAVVVAQTAAPALPHATRTAAVVAQTAVPVPARRPAHGTRSAVVWRRRPRNRAAAAATAAPMHEHDAAAAARRLVEWQPAAQVTWAAPVLRTGPPAVQAKAEAAAVATKQIVLVESVKNDDDLLDHHARVAQIEHPTATTIATDGERDCDDRRVIDKRTNKAGVGMEMEMEVEVEMELADDRTFDEFIKSQRRQMRQETESLQLVSSGYHYQYQAIATCY